MAQNEDQLNMRQQKREALRKKREAEQRKMKRNLILAAILLVACGVGIFSIAKNAGVKPGATPMVEEQVWQTEATEATEATTPKKSPLTTIHIKAAGDLNVTTSVVNAGLAPNGFNFTNAFIDVASTMASADLTVMNFEGNIYGQEYGTQTTVAPRELLDGLRSMGVDLVQTANSASINNGLIGLTSTLSAVRNAGMVPLGSYASSGDFQQSKGYTMCNVQGIRIAFVAFTKGVGGKGMPAGNEDCVNLLYQDYDSEYRKIDKEGIHKVLDAVEKEKPDITIAMLHWGSEFNETISESQKEIAKIMTKKGVDVIIGTHPHLVQTIEYDSLSGTLIAYSLGDFFGDGTKGGTNYSIILDVEITKDAELQTTRVTGFECIPIYTLQATDSQGDYSYNRVVRIEEAMRAYENNFVDKISKTAYESMQYALTRIDQRIATTKKIECPKCGESLEVLVSQYGNLVDKKTCKCGEILEKGSNYSDYD